MKIQNVSAVSSQELAKLKNMSLGKILIDSPEKGCCHLVANKIDLLHGFAKTMGLTREFFQNKKNKPYYCVRGRMLKLALFYGAEQVNSRDIVKFLKEHYA